MAKTFIGTNQIKKIWAGTDQIKHIWVGTEQVFSGALYLVENYAEKIPLAGLARYWTGSTARRFVPTKDESTGVWTFSISSGSATSGLLHLDAPLALANYSKLNYEIEIKHDNPNGLYKFYIENWSTSTSGTGVYIGEEKQSQQMLSAGANDFVMNSGALTIPSGTALNDICLGCNAYYNNIYCKIKNLWLDQ